MRVHLPLCRPALTIVAVLAVSAVLACSSDAYVAAPPSLAFSPGTNANLSTTRVFSTAGRSTYTCHIHPEMHGTVVVAASSTGGPSY